MKANRTSSNADRQPYQRLSFWIEERNQFWNTNLYSQKSKDYFNKWLSDWMKREKSLVNITQNIKAV